MSLEIPMTKLEAVNAMLADDGSRKTDTLTSPTRGDVIRAVDTLDRVSRSVQLRGHWFNTEKVTLTINGSSKYVVDAAIVHVEVISGGPTNGTHGTPKLVVRAGYLYDTVNGTNTFVNGPTIRAVVFRLLPYESLPSSAREYIYATASLRNNSQSFGSRAIDRDLKEQAETALALLNEEDIDAENLDQTLSPHFLQMMHLR